MNAIIPRPADLEPIVQLVTDSVDSPHTQRAYRRALLDFLAWYKAAGKPALCKATVQRYVAELRRQGLKAGNINQRLSAIRKLASEAADNGMLDDALAIGIGKVEGVKRQGKRAGNWLDKDQAQDLINAPDISTSKGLRDRAILCVLVGCGLRRDECANLTLEHVQQRDGRWVIVDLVGKGNKVRSVPMPSWAKTAIDAWTEAAGIGEGRIFRSIHKGGYVNGETMTDQAIADVVRFYTARCGYGVAAHDLRRTFAKLARKGGAELTQIQLSLGHSSVATTQAYVGEDQDLTDAPCDRLGLRLD